LKVAVKAPPVDGKANKELQVWLSKLLGVQRADVRLVAGAGSRDKTVAVGAALADVLAAIRSNLPESQGL